MSLLALNKGTIQDPRMQGRDMQYFHMAVSWELQLQADAYMPQALFGRSLLHFHTGQVLLVLKGENGGVIELSSFSRGICKKGLKL